MSKGSNIRPFNKTKYDENYDRIFANQNHVNDGHITMEPPNEFKNYNYNCIICNNPLFGEIASIEHGLAHKECANARSPRETANN